MDAEKAPRKLTERIDHINHETVIGPMMRKEKNSSTPRVGVFGQKRLGSEAPKTTSKKFLSHLTQKALDESL